jgi:hypothetical protein
MRELATGEGQTRRDSARALARPGCTARMALSRFGGLGLPDGPLPLSALGQPCGARAWLVAHSSA